MDARPAYVLVSTTSGNLLGEYPTRAKAEAVRDEYVRLDARNADALEIVFDDGGHDTSPDGELPQAS